MSSVILLYCTLLSPVAFWLIINHLAQLKGPHRVGGTVSGSDSVQHVHSRLRIWMIFHSRVYDNIQISYISHANCPTFPTILARCLHILSGHSVSGLPDSVCNNNNNNSLNLFGKRFDQPQPVFFMNAANNLNSLHSCDVTVRGGGCSRKVLSGLVTILEPSPCP